MAESHSHCNVNNLYLNFAFSLPTRAVDDGDTFSHVKTFAYQIEDFKT